MPDPDPGHFGPDFDSGSGLKSASTDPSPCGALTHSRLVDFLRTFWQNLYSVFSRNSHSTGPIHLPSEYAAVVCVCEEGGSASLKSGF
jgi:hypothetical protein